MSDSSIRESNSRLGLRLFWIYSVFYVGFVLVCAFVPTWSERKVVAGLNLAVLWGFLLIALAFVLAIIYGLSCKAESGAEVEE